jgi:hypothetical protein
MQDKKSRILLAQLNSNGDCLYATVIARQIKEVDYPNAHLTWAVNTKCLQSVLLNPYVDEVWEIPTLASLTTLAEWDAFVEATENRKKAGEFDKIFYTQIIGKATLDFDGGIRSTIYLQYPHKITVNQQPIIKLSDEEVAKVKLFVDKNQLQDFKQVILIECGPDSFKSSLNPESAKYIADQLTNNDPSIAVILSSNKKIENTTTQIIDGSILSFRANAELTKYCTLFVGCSSGISWLTTTNWAKPLQKIIVVNDSNYYNSSMIYDHQYAKLDTNNIIELKEKQDTSATLLDCITVTIQLSFEAAKKKYHSPFKLVNFEFFKQLLVVNKHNGNHKALFSATYRVIKRNGLRTKPILLFLKNFILLPKYFFKYKKST